MIDFQKIIHELPPQSAVSQLYVGYSGGLDSSVLLHVLAHSELKTKIKAIHVNHGLSVHALAWQNHCQRQCAQLNIPIIIKKTTNIPLKNLEENARNARYEALFSEMGAQDCLLLAHHRNDQAETVLLQLFRGAGIDGLAAMQALKRTENGWVCRPLLGYSREMLEKYGADQGLSWIEDASNNEQVFARNYIRHTVLPLIEKKWPAAVMSLSRAARHCQDAQVQLMELAHNNYPELDRVWKLDIALLQPLNALELANVMRCWLKKNAVAYPSSATLARLKKECIDASNDANPIVRFGNYSFRRYKNFLYLVRARKTCPTNTIVWNRFPDTCATPLGSLQACKNLSGVYIPPGSSVEIRWRQNGERIVLHKQTKTLKKLWQEWAVPTWCRQEIPLIYINEVLAVVVGYAIADAFYRDSHQYCYNLFFNTNTSNGVPA